MYILVMSTSHHLNTSTLYLIQVASLHLEEFVDRDAGTDGSNDDSKKEN